MGFSGFARPLAPATRLTSPLGPDEGLDGLVTIKPGAGTWVRPSVDGQSLIVDSVQGPPGFQLNHFHPGALPDAATIREWLVPSHLLGVVSSLVEVHILDPVTDVSNGHHVLTIAGSVSGSVQLPLNVADQQLYRLDLVERTALVTPPTGSSSSSGLPRATAQSFWVDQVETVTDVQYERSLPGAWRVGVIDGNAGEWLSFREVEDASNAPWLRLPRAVECEPDRVYFVAAEPIDHAGPVNELRGSARELAGSNLHVGTSGVSQYPEDVSPLAPDGSNESYSGIHLFVGTNAPANADLLDAVNSGVYFGYGDGGFAPSDFVGWTARNRHSRFMLAGRPDGLAIAGNVTVTSSLAGAPAAAPANLNIRLDANEQ